MKTLVVHIDRDTANTARIKAAFKLAEQFGAHVTACHPIPPVNIYMPASMVPVDAGQVVPQLMEVAKDTAKRLKKDFADTAPKSGATWDWSDSVGEAVDVLIDESRLADLTLVSLAPSSSEVDDPLDLAGDLAVSGGLPVLAVPSSGRLPAKDKPVMVAWNGSLEASRAIRAAMPFLKRASEVVIVEVGEDAPSILPAADLAPYLARHGLKVSTRNHEADDSIGETLMKAAHGIGAELIVMGAYGHSRLREFIFGGATRHLLHQDEIPVLLNN